ncbi:hypothetical protein [Salinispira pacifica]
MEVPQLVESRCIWAGARHNAFTDLIRFRERWFCTFREASGHLHGKGKIRIISSEDGRSFEDTALFAERGVDLRDPKLSVTPKNQLMLLFGGSRFRRGEYVGRQPRVCFSVDGERWEEPQPVMSEGDWLWRVTWHRGHAYGISYRLKNSRTWTIELVESSNGTDYRRVAPLAVPGRPNESTIRFLPDGSALALVRREGGDRSGWIGRSSSPYTAWEWHSAGSRLGGPNFIVLPNGNIWAAGRRIAAGDARTVLARLAPDRYQPVLELPSGGDCSYPGMAYYRGRLWMSYYSSHEGRTSIYLAVVRFA